MRERPPTSPDVAPLIDREVFFGNPRIVNGQLSPDGRWLSFVQPLDAILNVWVKRIEEPFDAARPMTDDRDRPVVQSFWSRDARRILFVQDRAGNENFHVYAVDPAAPIAAGARVPPALDLTPGGEIQARIYELPEDDPRHAIVGINDRDPRLHDVWRLDLWSGKRELLLANEENVAEWVADLAGRLRLGHRQSRDGGWEVLRVDEDRLTPVYACGPEEECRPIRFHVDGARVYMETSRGAPDLSRLVLLDPTTGETEEIESDPEGEVDFGGTLFAADTHELIATWYTGDRVRWYPHEARFAADLDRARRELPDGDVGFRSMTRDGNRMLVSAISDVEPGASWLYDRGAGTFELLYRTRPEIPSRHMARTTAISYKARDGLEVPAYLTLPRGSAEAALPTVLFPHGGPWARDTWGFNNIVQFLANRGYAVLQPNFRGSTGFGKRFLNLGNREWGTGAMQHDLTDGVRWLVERGTADPERVAIMGGSYGGYAALAGVAFTPDLYAAAVSIVGPSSIPTLLESIPPYWEPVRRTFSVRVGDPEDPADLERMRGQSPLYAADRIRTPLLVVQGANDPRVKKAESDQIVRALRELGHEVEYLVAEDEGHGFASEESNQALFAKIEEFLATHLGGRFQADAPERVRKRLDALVVDVATV
ncbi:MAG TPA: S9 family peptidase [Gemmatimonadota bacterium]|jgi:dipeptidyl aminopeptidase/acylaminoacyl peptidase